MSCTAQMEVCNHGEEADMDSLPQTKLSNHEAIEGKPVVIE
jgi:hypothetical protein